MRKMRAKGAALIEIRDAVWSVMAAMVGAYTAA